MMKDSNKYTTVNDALDAISIGYYIEKSIPRPTFMECLTDFLKDGDILKKNTKYIINDFANNYEKYKQESRNHKKELPKEAITFVIPLDYYLPIPERYYASTYDNGSLIQSSVYHYEIQISQDRLRLSFIAITINNKKTGKIAKAIKKNNYPAIGEVYDVAIVEANRIIRSFLALTKRHNHYVHEITRIQLPSTINTLIFHRNTKKIIYKTILFAHRAPIHDFLSAELLNREELGELSNYHWNAGITNNNVLKLLSKLNDAINARCLGKDSESILLMESFVEYSLGFLYCECLRIENSNRPLEECASKYITECKKRGFSAERKIASILGYKSNDEYETFKEKIGKEAFKESCKDVRNILTHNFFSTKAESIHSEEAIESAGNYVCSIAKEILKQAADPSSIEQIKILITATEMLTKR